MYKVDVLIVKRMMIESHMKLFQEKDHNGPSYDEVPPSRNLNLKARI